MTTAQDGSRRCSAGRLLFVICGVFALALASAPWKALAAPEGRAAIAYAHISNAGKIVPLPNGQLLITDIGNLDRTGAQVIITDFKGDLVWRYRGSLDIPHSAYPMPNGDILIADTGDNRVIEVNRASHIVWDSDDLGNGHGVIGQGTMSDGRMLSYPNDAQPLANGEVLISCRLQNRVIIINSRGQILRQIYGFLHGQHNPTPLANGDMFISDSGADRILEVDSSNHVVWEYGGQRDGVDTLNWPRDAVMMPDGNALITDSDHNRLIEVTHSKKIVRQWTNLARPYAATPLPNGNILVGDGSNYGVVELSRQDRIVWKLNHASTRPGTPASWHVRNGSFEHSVNGSKSILSHWRRNDALAYDVRPGRRATMVRDCTVFHKGRCSGRITYHGDSNGIYFGQIVRLVPGHHYRFSGWLRTKDVEPCTPCIYGPQDPRGHTAEFELEYNSGSGAPVPAPALPQHTGTSRGWIHDTTEFTVPANVRSLGIQCELRGQGTVWFDDVWVQELS